MAKSVTVSINEIIEQVCGTSISLSNLKKIMLRKETKDELVKRICEIKCAEYIKEAAKQIPQLSEENLKDLTLAMREIGEIEEQCDYLAEVQNLTEENSDILLCSIFGIPEMETASQKVKK